MNPVQEIPAGASRDLVAQVNHLTPSMVETQCRDAISILSAAAGERPVTLHDFKETLEKSLQALSVSNLFNFLTHLKIQFESKIFFLASIYC